MTPRRLPAAAQVRAAAGAGAQATADTDITTQRLLLTALRAADAGEMAAVLVDERLHEFIGGHPASPADLRRRFARLEAGSSDPAELWLNWIARLRDGGAAIGTVQATLTHREGTVTACLAWVIGVPWQRRGLASEAAIGMAGWLRARGVDELTAHIHTDHRASARVAARVGLTPAGDYVDGERVWRWAVGTGP